MKRDELEKKLIKEFWEGLNRAIACPHQMCYEQGQHFVCYDLSYEECPNYIRKTTPPKHL